MKVTQYKSALSCEYSRKVDIMWLKMNMYIFSQIVLKRKSNVSQPRIVFWDQCIDIFKQRHLWYYRCVLHAYYTPFAGFKKEQVFQPLCVHLSNNREDLINVITFYTGNTLLTLNSLVCVYNDPQVGQCQVHCVQKCLSSAYDIKLSDSIKNV